MEAAAAAGQRRPNMETYRGKALTRGAESSMLKSRRELEPKWVMVVCLCAMALSCMLCLIASLLLLWRAGGCVLCVTIPSAVVQRESVAKHEEYTHTWALRSRVSTPTEEYTHK